MRISRGAVRADKRQRTRRTARATLRPEPFRAMLESKVHSCPPHTTSAPFLHIPAKSSVSLLRKPVVWSVQKDQIFQQTCSLVAGKKADSSHLHAARLFGLDYDHWDVSFDGSIMPNRAPRQAKIHGLRSSRTVDQEYSASGIDVVLSGRPAGDDADLLPVANVKRAKRRRFLCSAGECGASHYDEEKISNTHSFPERHRHEGTQPRLVGNDLVWAGLIMTSE